MMEELDQALELLLDHVGAAVALPPCEQRPELSRALALFAAVDGCGLAALCPRALRPRSTEPADPVGEVRDWCCLAVWCSQDGDLPSAMQIIGEVGRFIFWYDINTVTGAAHSIRVDSMLGLARSAMRVLSGDLDHNQSELPPLSLLGAAGDCAADQHSDRCCGM